jgi:hypothetical protein
MVPVEVYLENNLILVLKKLKVHFSDYLHLHKHLLKLNLVFLEEVLVKNHQRKPSSRKQILSLLKASEYLASNHQSHLVNLLLPVLN